MKISVLGRGISNHYRGFEQCAEYLALGLVKRGFEVVVYDSHDYLIQVLIRFDDKKSTSKSTHKRWCGKDICLI